MPCRKYDKDKTGRFVIGTNNFRIDGLKQHGDITYERKHEIECLAKQSKIAIWSYTGAEGSNETGASSSRDVEKGCVIGSLEIALRRLNEEHCRVSWKFRT